MADNGENAFGGIAREIQDRFGNVKETITNTVKKAHGEVHEAVSKIHKKTGDALGKIAPNKEEDKETKVLQSPPPSNMQNSSVGPQVVPKPTKLPRTMGGRSRSKKRSRSKTHKKKKKSRSKKGAGDVARAFYVLSPGLRMKIKQEAINKGANNVVNILRKKDIAHGQEKYLNEEEFINVKDFADKNGLSLGNVPIVHRGGSNCHNTKKKKKGRKARKARKSKKAKKHKKRGKKGGISRRKRAGCNSCGCRK